MIIQPYIIEAAQVSHKRFYPRGPFVSVTLAQWILESDWGRYVSGKNNYFGIKANAEQIAEGKFTVRLTHETTPRGQYIKIPQRFADYDTLEEGFDAHAALLTTPHYRDCMMASTPEDYCRALWKDGYATGEPNEPYDLVLIRIMQGSNLKQYDQGGV